MHYSWRLQEPLWRKEYSGSKSFKSFFRWGGKTAYPWVYILLFFNSYRAQGKPPQPQVRVTKGGQGQLEELEVRVTGRPALCRLSARCTGFGGYTCRVTLQHLGLTLYSLNFPLKTLDSASAHS